MVMKTWIYVRSSDNFPLLRKGRRFIKWEDAIDPNVPHKFGPTKPTRFLEVRQEAEPAYDPSTQYLFEVKTVGEGGKIWRGEFYNDEWVIRSAVRNMGLKRKKSIRKSDLHNDMIARTDLGYSNNTRTLDLDIDVMNLLDSLTNWLERARANNTVPANHQITFNDRDERAVVVNFNQLRNLYTAYGLVFTNIAMEYARARREIRRAANLIELNEVNWDFTVL